MDQINKPASPARGLRERSQSPVDWCDLRGALNQNAICIGYWDTFRTGIVGGRKNLLTEITQALQSHRKQYNILRVAIGALVIGTRS